MAERHLSRTCASGLRELIKGPCTSVTALGCLGQPAPQSPGGEAAVPEEAWADLRSVFALKERLCKDKSFEAQAQLPSEVARLAGLHGDHRSTAVPSHFPRHRSESAMPGPGACVSTSHAPGRGPGWVPCPTGGREGGPPLSSPGEGHLGRQG